LTECCQAVDAYARQRGVPTLYEVCNHYEVPLIHSAAEYNQFIGSLAGSNIRLILDSFHMNINEPDSLATLRANAPRTAIYHISDSGRGGIGSGQINFKAQHDVLVGAGFDGAVAIEPVLPHLTPSTPPASEQDQRLLDEEITRSARLWRGYWSG
jgi:sugar phosphate isomerase/epimerase